MNEPGRYEPTWRDDAELDALLRIGKIIGLADIDRALDFKAGHQAVPVEGSTELPDLSRLWRKPCTGSPTPSPTPISLAARFWRCPTATPPPAAYRTRARPPAACPTRARPPAACPTRSPPPAACR